MTEDRPAERLLARVRARREPPAPVLLDAAATMDDWREAYNDLAGQVADLRRQIAQPSYALWVGLLTAAAAIAAKYAGV